MKNYSEDLCNLKHSNIDEKLLDIKEDLKIISEKIDNLNKFKFKLIGSITIIVSILTFLSELLFKHLQKGI